MRKSWLLGIGLYFGFSVAAAADKISLYALFQDKAMIVVNGERFIVRVGESTPMGLTLLSTDTEAEEAMVSINGKRERLRLGVVSEASVSDDKPAVTLYADINGFFHAEGSINGFPLKFLVDTGANTIALNAATARRAGIDYTRGQPGTAKTASGFAKMYLVKLNVVKIGGIVMRNVDAGVIDGPQPDTPLLGMSFLGSLEMRRDGHRMELIQKY